MIINDDISLTFLIVASHFNSWLMTLDKAKITIVIWFYSTGHMIVLSLRS